MTAHKEVVGYPQKARGKRVTITITETRIGKFPKTYNKRWVRVVMKKKSFKKVVEDVLQTVSRPDIH